MEEKKPWYKDWKKPKISIWFWVMLGGFICFLFIWYILPKLLGGN